MSGYRAIRVRTRNGLFANEGHGGGVFNGNTAFGGYGEASARPVMGTSLGRSLDNEDDAYPYNKFSMATQVLQSQINEQLRLPPMPPDMCPIVVDGFLAGDTCGALEFLFWDKPSACDENKDKWRAPKRGNCPFIGYQTGDPCAAPNTIKTVQQYLGAKPDGVWGPTSQKLLEASGKSYCSIVPSCADPLPPGVTCPGYESQPITVPDLAPAPVIVPEPEPEETKPKQMNMGALVVGGLLAAAAVAVFMKKGKK